MAASSRLRDSFMPGSAKALNPMVEAGQIVVNLMVDEMAIDMGIDSDAKQLYYASAGKPKPAQREPIREQDRRTNPQYHLLAGELAYKMRDPHATASMLNRPLGRKRDVISSVPVRTSLATLQRPPNTATTGLVDPQRKEQEELARALAMQQIEVVAIVKAPDSAENLGGAAVGIVQGTGTFRNNGTEAIITGDLVEWYIPTESELETLGAGATKDEKSGLRPRLCVRPYRPNRKNPHNFRIFQDAMTHFRKKYFNLDPASPNDAAVATDALFAHRPEADPVTDFWRKVMWARYYGRLIGRFAGEPEFNPADVNDLNDALNRLGAARAVPEAVRAMAADVNLQAVPNFKTLSHGDRNFLMSAMLLNDVWNGRFMMLSLDSPVRSDAEVWSEVFGRELQALAEINVNTTFSRIIMKATSTAPPNESFNYIICRQGY